jgi:hypothetical protein
MTAPQPSTPPGTIQIELLHEGHPLVRAQDWRSPLVARLLESEQYQDDSRALAVSYRGESDDMEESELLLSWSGLATDYEQCINTYQDTVITEFAALAVACVLCSSKAGLQVTEVTKRGEKVDYWLGDRAYVLEVSGTIAGDLNAIAATKATNQLQSNPFDKDGYVCVARFHDPEARLWFYKYPNDKP